MKRSHVCPKCGGQSLLHVQRAMNSHQYNAASVIRLALRGTAIAGAVLGLEPGALDALVCRACGYMELYVREPETITADGETIREVR
jgi:predicted nucleic-acid-binding Zn-ribbon protein